MPLCLLLVLGCTEYNVGEKDDVGPGDTDTATPLPEGEPDLSVSPTGLEEVVCTTTEQVITLSNVGDADLTITGLTLSGDGWSFGSIDPLPWTLAPTEAVDVPVTGTLGTAELVVESDDPDTPSWTVSLEATADTVPWVVITSPADGTIIDPGADVTLVAEVGDTEDAAEALSVTWTSDTDGALGTASVDPAGYATLTWPDTPRTEGDQTLQVTVEDTCGGQSGDELTLCQQAGYVVDELDLSAWHFEGDAQWDTTNDWLQLTSAGTYLVGTAFKTDELVDGGSVEITFLFYIGDGSGADGLSLTVIDKDRMTTFLGGTGCGIGYGGDASCTGGPALPGWSLEVDTYDNGSVDPTPDDHLTFTFDGDGDDWAAWATLPEMEDTGWHELTVVVADPHLTVAVDGTTYIDEDVSGGSLAFEGYVGFTAGTGSATNLHLIDSLEVTEYTCEE